MYVGEGSTAAISNSTFSGNDADIGGGIFTDGSTAYADRLVAGNLSSSTATADCSGGPEVSGGFNLLGLGTGCAMEIGTDRTEAPSSILSTVLRPLVPNGGLTPTRMLRFTGANGALDIGGTCPALDQRNFLAPVDGPDAGTAVACDAGAVEAQGPVTANVVLSPAMAPAQVPASGGMVAYRAKVTNVSGATRSFDVWSRIQRPDGTVTATLFGPVSVLLAPNASVTYPLSHSPTGPTGLYEVQFFAGTFSAVVGGSDAFAVSKAGRA